MVDPETTDRPPATAERDPIDRTLVVSDVHLGAVPPATEERFLDFLSGVPDEAGRLLIVGDLFDFWFEYRSVILKEHFPALRALARASEAGVRVVMLGGNHDAWGGPFLRHRLGVHWVEGPTVLDLHGRRTLVAHGDGVGSGDWAYRIFKRAARSRPARALFRAVHPDLAARAARVASQTPRRARRDPTEEDRKRARVLSRRAREILADRSDLDMVLFGHAHRPEVREVSNERHYLNPGDWVHHDSYGVLTADDVRVERWSDGEPRRER